MSIPFDKETIVRYRKTIEKRLGNNIKSKRSVLIGHPFQEKLIYANTEKTLIYVHGLGNEPASIETIPATSDLRNDMLIYGRPILLEQNSAGRWVFYKVDTEADIQYSGGLKVQHDQTPVKLSQLDYGTLHPQTGLVLLVKAALYDNNYVDNILTADFSTGTVQDTSAANITIPTTNNRAKGVLVQIDPIAGTLSYKQSSEFVATISLSQAYSNGLLSSPDSGNYRVGYFKLIKGITQFDYSHLWVVPEFLSKGDGTWPITLSANRTLSANTQIVLAELIIPTGITLTIESTAIMKVV